MTTTSSADIASASNFEGWFLGETSTYVMTCDEGVRFQTSGRFGICCDQEPCAMATVCANNVVTYDDSHTFACGTAYSCVTMTVYQTPGPQGGSPTSAILCGANWEAHTIYRTTPVATTTSSSTETSSTTRSRASNGIFSSPTTTPTETSTPGSGSSNQGWIAGAVVGPLALVALVGLGWFFLRKRRIEAAKKAEKNTPEGEPFQGGPVMQAAGGQGWNGSSYQPTNYQGSEYNSQFPGGTPYQTSSSPGFTQSTSPGYPPSHSPGMQPAMAYGYQQQQQQQQQPYQQQQAPPSELGTGWNEEPSSKPRPLSELPVAPQSPPAHGADWSQANQNQPASELPVDPQFGAGR